MTCTFMRKLVMTWLKCAGKKETPKTRFQSAVLDDIFRGGNFKQLIWFQENLKYLSAAELNEKKKLLVAFEGDVRLLLL